MWGKWHSQKILTIQQGYPWGGSSVANPWQALKGFKSNCLQEPTDGKNFQFLIPSFGLRKHCHGYKLCGRLRIKSNQFSFTLQTFPFTLWHGKLTTLLWRFQLWLFVPKRPPCSFLFIREAFLVTAICSCPVLFHVICILSVDLTVFLTERAYKKIRSK